MKFKIDLTLECSSIPVDNGLDPKDLAEIIATTMASGAANAPDPQRNIKVLGITSTYEGTVTVKPSSIRVSPPKKPEGE